MIALDMPSSSLLNTISTLARDLGELMRLPAAPFITLNTAVAILSGLIRQQTGSMNGSCSQAVMPQPLRHGD